MNTHKPWPLLSLPLQVCHARALVTAAIRLLLLWLLVFPAVVGATGEDIEDSVKAAFLYKFAGYVDWPETRFADANTPITIAVMGADPIAEELSRIVVGRTAHERMLAVKRLRPGDSIDGIHILFISRTKAPWPEQMLQAAQANSILVVTDEEGALTWGSMINFVLDERRLKFEVALDNAENSGLRVSSRLLAVARQVYREAD